MNAHCTAQDTTQPKIPQQQNVTVFSKTSQVKSSLNIDGCTECNGSETSRNTADYFQSGLDCCSLRDRDTVQYSWCLWVGCIANKSERWAVMLTLANPDASPGKSLQRCESRSCYPHTPALHPSTLHPGPVSTASVFHPRVTCGPCFALASPTVTYCTFGKTLKLANCLVCALLNFPFAL